MLLECYSLFLVFDEIAVGRFLFFPAAALHRGGRRGILQSLDRSHVVRRDVDDPLVKIQGFRGILKLKVVPGKFVQGFDILGRAFDDGLEGKCRQLGELCRQGGFLENLVELGISRLVFQGLLRCFNRCQRVFFYLGLDLHRAE